MSNVLPSALTARISLKQSVSKRSDRMLSELLALNEDMIAQLRLERQEAVGTTDFITGLIGDHEKAAAKLSAQLRSFEADAGAKPSNELCALDIRLAR
jgi:hypothetical protein